MQLIRKHLNINHLKIFVALCLLYISWGSTYIGIKFSLPVLPAFFMCGLRMAFAGILLYAATWVSGERVHPSWRDIRYNAMLAFFMVLVASGFLSKGQEYISSGTAAVINGAVPIWMLVSGWLFAGEPRPTLRQCFGLCGGFAGLVLLASSQGSGDTEAIGGMLWVFVGTLGWIAGSLYSKSHPMPSLLSPLRACAVLLFLGGLQSLLTGLLWGELDAVHLENINLSAILGFSWLVVGGALLGYSCYFWLLRNTPMTMAISYEYAVPVIGMFLGWLLGGETITPRMMLACCLTVGSVIFIIMDRHREPRIRPAQTGVK